MEPHKTRVSVLIPTKNEASNIRECIQSVQFATEVVVVDSDSTDGTVEMAKELGARVVNFKWNGEYPKKKNWALEHYPWRNEWVLILDADERITPALAEEIAEKIQSGTVEGYYINRQFMFMGKWIRHCGYFPSYNLRLFRCRKARYERMADVGDTGSGDNEVHEHLIIGDANPGKVEYLKEPMLHFAYPTISVWVEKHNRYSNWEAAVHHSRQHTEGLAASFFGGPLERKRWLKKLVARLPLRPTMRFLYHYVFKLGILDGYEGFVLCRLLALYEFLSVAKAREIELTRPDSSGDKTVQRTSSETPVTAACAK